MGQRPMLVGKPDDMPGFSLWLVGRVSAPKSIRRRYLARIVCNATGRCPYCGAISGDSNQAELGVQPSANIVHESDCVIGDNGPSLDHWLAPAAEPLRNAIARGG